MAPIRNGTYHASIVSHLYTVCWSDSGVESIHIHVSSFPLVNEVGGTGVYSCWGTASLAHQLLRVLKHVTRHIDNSKMR